MLIFFVFSLIIALMEQSVEKQIYIYHNQELTEPSAILYYKQAHYLEKLENKLLGNFDKKGKYVISNDILKELVALKKNITSSEKNKVYANAKCSGFTFKFLIESGSIDDQTKYASLKLLEEYSTISGDKKSTVITPVVYYKDADNQYFDDKIKKLFNLNTKDETDGKENNEEVAKLILKSLSISEKTLQAFLKQTRLRDKLYVENMLKIFEKSGKFGEFALRRYNALLKEYSSILNPKADNYYHILKQILDKILLEEEKSLSKDVALLIQRLRKKYVQTIDNFIDVVIKNPPKKVEEKPVKLKGNGGLVFKGEAYKSAPAKKAAAKKFDSPLEFDKKQNITFSEIQNDFKQTVERHVQPKQNEEQINWKKDIQDFIKQMESLTDEKNKDIIKTEEQALSIEESNAVKKNLDKDNILELL